ncbi:MAG: hypothetical protein U0470_14705 [Anaerolineae bacterium]
MNALCTSERRRAWSAPSRSSMFRSSGRNTAGTHGIRAACSGVIALRGSFTKRSSLSAATTSS